MPVSAHGRGDTLASETPDNLTHGQPLHRQHLEDTAHDRHLCWLHDKTVAMFVVNEAVGRSRSPHQLALSHHAVLPASGPLNHLEPLSLAHPALHVSEELALVGVVPPVVQGDQASPEALELLVQEAAVYRVACDPIRVLGDHRGDAAALHQVAYPIQARPLQMRPALAGVRDLLQDLVALVFAPHLQSLDLLAETVAALGLLPCGDAAV